MPLREQHHAGPALSQQGFPFTLLPSTPALFSLSILLQHNACRSQICLYSTDPCPAKQALTWQEMLLCIFEVLHVKCIWKPKGSANLFLRSKKSNGRPQMCTQTCMHTLTQLRADVHAHRPHTCTLRQFCANVNTQG